MAIRLPINLKSQTFANETGTSSAAGGIAIPVTLPMDTDNVVVKFSASMVGAVSATLQTTDDGGTTWYDVARSSLVSNTPAGFEEWISAPVISAGINPIVNSTANSGSILGGTIGRAPASTLSQRQVSGLPILSQAARVFLIISGNVTSAASNTMTAQVKVNSQSATA